MAVSTNIKTPDFWNAKTSKLDYDGNLSLTFDEIENIKQKMAEDMYRRRQEAFEFDMRPIVPVSKPEPYLQEFAPISPEKYETMGATKAVYPITKLLLLCEDI